MRRTLGLLTAILYLAVSLGTSVLGAGPKAAASGYHMPTSNLNVPEVPSVIAILCGMIGLGGFISKRRR